MALLKFALKATNGVAPFKYLGVIDDGTKNQGYLAYTTDAVLTKNANFIVEYAPGGENVHIRSGLTNKYWSRSPTKNGNWIVAEEDKPVVDKALENCTLFRIDIKSDRKATIHHVQTGHAVRIPDDGSDRSMFLSIDPAAKTVAVSVAVDYDFVVLPKLIAFRGTNGLYYKNYSPGENGYASFSVSDIGDPNIVCEGSNSNDGHVRIRAVNMDAQRMFWCGNPSKEALIAWDSEDPNNPNQMFDAKMIDNDTVALRSRANNKFCVRADFNQSRSPKDRLVAKADSMTADTYLKLVEPVLKRSVTAYEFYLDKARIYNVTPLFSHEHVWDNPSKVPQSGSANGTISTTRTRSFSNTVTATVGVKTTFETGIPFIVKGGIEVSASASYAYQWGESVAESETIGDVFNVTVLPEKRTVAKGIATKATCDVPFAYIQRDYPQDGGPVIVTKLKDGIFTGTKAYNFQTKFHYEDIPPQSASLIADLTESVEHALLAPMIRLI